MDDLNFSIPLTVRVGDLNYGNHVGHQNYLLYFQEARMAYLRRFGFYEHDIAGFRMVLVEAGCTYKKELNHRDAIVVKCGVRQLKSKAFIMAYQIEKDGRVCAEGTTTSLCLDRQSGKVVRLPAAFVKAVCDFEGVTSGSER